MPFTVESYSDTPFQHWVLRDLCRAYLFDIPPKSWHGWLRYHNSLESKRTTRHMNCLDPLLQGIFHDLICLVRPLEELTGIDGLEADPWWHGSGLHVMGPDDFVQGHVDYEIHPEAPHLERRLSLVLCLSPAWEASWGGETLLMDGNGKTIEAIVPSPGKALLFENGPASYHGVRVIADHAPERVTAAVYYLAPRRETASRRRALFFPNRDEPNVPREVS